MRRAVLLLFLFFNTDGISQHIFIKQWDYRYGGSGWEGICSIIKTVEDGFLFGGSSNSRLSGDLSEDNRDITGVSNDFWIVKTDSLGILQWEKRFGGSWSEYMRVIIQTNDNCYLLGGSSASSNDGDKSQPSQGGFDFWVLKVDQQGNKLWDKRFGGTGNDDLEVAIATIDGGFLLGGPSGSGIGGDRTESSWGHQDYWVVKIDSVGNKLWDKRFGGGGSDMLTSLVQTEDEGYIIAGNSSLGAPSGDYTNPSFGSNDYWLIKINSIGTKQWVKNYGGDSFEDCKTIIKTVDGNYMIGGVSRSDISGNKTDSLMGFGYDYWVVKIDSSGNKIWDKTFGGTLTEERLSSLQQTTDNGYLISGVSQSQIGGHKTENNLGESQTWIVKIDEFGNLQWDKTLLTVGSNHFSLGGFVIQSSNECFVSANAIDGGIGGYKTQPNWDPTDSTYDQWIIKFCDTTLSTSINSLYDNTNAFNIYPNPSSGKVKINFSNSYPMETEIFIEDISGRIIEKIINVEYAFYEFQYDLSNFKPGMYRLSLKTKDKLLVKKLVLQ